MCRKLDWKHEYKTENWLPDSMFRLSVDHNFNCHRSFELHRNTESRSKRTGSVSVDASNLSSDMANDLSNQRLINV